MYLLIPLGGTGKRFKEIGYEKPKPLINVLGKPILYWLLETIDNKFDKIIIPYNTILSKYRFEDSLRKDFPKLNFDFYPMDKTNGALETVYLCLSNKKLDNKPILCVDGDNFYNCNVINDWKGNNTIFTFIEESNNDNYSYLEINNIITNIVEKEKISNYACCGGYGFENVNELLHYSKHVIENNIKQKGEFYISNVIKQMLSLKFTPTFINKKDFICLGTPLQVRVFCNNYPVKSALDNQNKIEVKRFCFDLDNTLVTFPKIKDDYSSVEPIHEVIDMVKYLKKMGHEIIIYTARRMKTHKGNNGKIIADIGKVTFDTLDKFDIPYDEIYFGKPYAHFYIDDLAVSSFDNLQKELGFYKSKVEPRYFNNIQQSSLNIYTKTSNDLSGEIYWYKNIPEELKDLFPIFINNEGNTKYNMEEVDGVPLSRLYLSEDLTTQQLDYVLNSIKRLHNTKMELDDIDINSNYNAKLEERWNNYDYSNYTDSLTIKNLLSSKLLEYKAKQTIIHGDPVFTNIIINQYGKIKLIDMRGKQGNKLSIQGDVLYDWAKIYQSLIGYDEILFNTYVKKEYKTKMLDCFKNHFLELYSIQDWNYLQYITASLLFTLIPLHNNDKCQLYYNLLITLI